MENSIFYVNNSWHYSILYFMLKCLIIVLIFICLLLFTWFYCFMLQEKRKIKNLIYIWQCVVNVVDNKELYLKKNLFGNYYICWIQVSTKSRYKNLALPILLIDDKSSIIRTLLLKSYIIKFINPHRREMWHLN